MNPELIAELTKMAQAWHQQIDVDPSDQYDEGYNHAKHECYEGLTVLLRTHSAEIAGALRDAERYRWLREHVTDRFVRNNEHEPCLLLPHNVDYLSPDEIDTAIDSAMQQGGGGGDSPPPSDA